jgi:hypothetical protein
MFNVLVWQYQTCKGEWAVKRDPPLYPDIKASLQMHKNQHTPIDATC